MVNQAGQRARYPTVGGWQLLARWFWPPPRRRLRAYDVHCPLPSVAAPCGLTACAWPTGLLSRQPLTGYSTTAAAVAEAATAAALLSSVM